MPPHELLVKKVPKVPKTTQVITTALGYPPQQDGKTLLLKIQHHNTLLLQDIENSSQDGTWNFFPLTRLHSA